jgi:ribosomal protein S18 acetylase RimI-like enzyme
VTTLSHTIAVRPATRHDRAGIASALTAAFFDDPVVSWLVPDAARRREVLPPMFGLFADAFLPHGEVLVAGEGVGASLWVPPGVQPVADDEAEEFGARIEQTAGEDAPRMFELMELMDANHPHEPSYYLNLVGVLPDHQGQGLGSALMTPILEKCDREGAPAYLEATSEHNRRLYMRHGFEVIGEIAPAGGPSLWPMWRRPQVS